MVLYCTLTGASVTNMFSQGMVIGILIMIVLILEALYYAHKEKWPKAETKHTAGEIGKIFLEAVPALLTPVILLGGRYRVRCCGLRVGFHRRCVHLQGDQDRRSDPHPDEVC